MDRTLPLFSAVCEKLARALMQGLRRAVKRRHGLTSVTPLHAGVMVAVHMVRYFGVFASHHHLRPRVVPGRDAELPGQQLPLAFAGRDSAEPDGPPGSKAPRRIGWASLLARVFAVDVTVCRKCGGRMRILEVVDTPDAIARVLHGARAPPRPPPPGQLLLLR